MGMFKQARKDITAFKKANRADLVGDYGTTANQLDSIYRNLGTSGAGTGAAMTTSQARELAAIARIRARGNTLSGRAVRGAQREATNLYGTAMGQVASEALRPARATAGATRTGSKAAAAAGGLLARGGQDALGIMQAGASEAQASAEYALNAALKSRGQADAADAAAMEFELQKMRLGYRLEAKAAEEAAALDFEYFKQKLDYENEAAADAGRVSLSQVFTQAPQAGAWMAGHLGEFEVDADGKPTDVWHVYTAAELAGNFARQAGSMGPDGSVLDLAKYQLVLGIANSMVSGLGPVEATQQAVAAIYGDQDGFNVENVNETLMTAIRGQNEARRSELLNKATSVGLTGSEMTELGRLLNSLYGAEQGQLLMDQLRLNTKQLDDPFGVGDAAGDAARATGWKGESSLYPPSWG